MERRTLKKGKEEQEKEEQIINLKQKCKILEGTSEIDEDLEEEINPSGLKTTEKRQQMKEGIEQVLN